jgi:prephenate dehydrogenase
MSSFDNVAIIGLGLIGGSIARDLAPLGVRISAYDPDTTHLAAALRTNVLNVALESSLEGLRDADVVITDVGSTKARIVELASDLGLGDRFVGGHPLAGDHRSGWEASRSGLFRDARVFLCPAREASSTAVDLAHEFWRTLGAAPERIGTEEHDLQLAWTSHLPHLVSTSLALALGRAGVARSDLGPGGRDVTRLAGSSPEMWAAIALENAAAMEVALRETEREISGFRALLKQADAAKVLARFAAARGWFDGPGARSVAGETRDVE